MNLNWSQLVKDAANAQMLVPSVAIGVACFLGLLKTFGYFEMGDSVTVLEKILFLLACQALLVAWVISGVPENAHRWEAFLFAMKMQAQAAMQVYLAVYASAATVLGTFYALNWIEPDQGLTDLISAKHISWLNEFLILICPLIVLFITALRLHDLRMKDIDFLSVSQNVLNRFELALQASKEATAARLEYYLEKLKLEGTFGLARLWYGNKPKVRIYSVNGNRVFEIRWAWCPAMIRVEVEPTGLASALVRSHCLLRSGYWKTDLFVNPQDAMALMKNMQINVFQLLESDLKLTASTTRQDILRTQALEMQLRILQAQIEPHFLFNTLANVRHLYRSSVDEGESMMDHLIVYLRSTLEELRSDVSTVSKEMDLVLHYLAIMKIRMGDRLSYSFIISEGVAVMAFPPAMLISLVENALMHGLNSKPDGKLTISAALEDQHLRVTVLDNGAGFSSVQGSGVGLSNIRQRLEAMYGTRAWLEVGAMASGGFMASIIIPISESA